MTNRAGLAFAMFLSLCGCGASAGDASRALPAVQPGNVAHLPVHSYIKHVVIIVQENRSFDNIFDGFPGADTATAGLTSTGQKVTLHPVAFNGTGNVSQDMGHGEITARQSWDNGKMDGFNINYFSPSNLPVGTFPYAYLERKLVAPYWTMAEQYVLADHMFPTMFGASFTAHLDLIAGTANLSPSRTEVDEPTDGDAPWGCDAPPGTKTYTLSTLRGPATSPVPTPNASGPPPCFTQFATMAGTLDAAKVTWRYYAPNINTPGDVGGNVWSEFDAIKSVRDNPSEWTASGHPTGSGVSWPPTNVLLDTAAGQLPSVSWVIPDYAWSDHAHADTNEGPSWVAAVVNAIGKSPAWKSTAIVVVWDDWGGWYDNVPPPQPTYNGQPDFIGLGIRVPCIIISPYAKKGYVSHTQYEFGSILKFVEEAFDLPPLGNQSDGYTDSRAASILDAFDFTQAPRSFTPIPATYPASFFLNQPSSDRAPDDD